MARGPELTVEKRSSIIALFRAGLSYTEISNLEQVKKATVGQVVRRWKREGRIATNPRPGRPRTVFPQKG